MLVKRLLCLVFFFFLFSLFHLYPQSTSELDRLIDQGIAYERENKLSQAVEVYRKVLERDRSNILVKVRLAKVLSWMNEFDEALSMLNEVLEDEPYQPEALFRKAQIMSWQGKYSESIETYQIYLQQNQDDPDALMGIARVYFWSGRNEEAIVYFFNAMQAGVDEIDARLNLGKVYLAMDNKAMAKEEFNKVLEIDPDNAEARRFLEGIPTIVKYEISPSGFIWDIYPDKSLGITSISYMTYHHNQKWNFTTGYENSVINATHDHTFSLASVYLGISNFYLRGGLSFTPDSDFSPGISTELGVNYSFKNAFGAGIGFKADVYTDAPLSSISNDTLFAIKPEIVKYFGDISHILLRYNQYLYSSGYSTATVSLSLNLEYYKKNSILAAFTYGGDVETRDSDRRVFELGLGISYNLTENFELFLNYSLVDTQNGKTNEISWRPLVKW